MKPCAPEIIYIYIGGSICRYQSSEDPLHGDEILVQDHFVGAVDLALEQFDRLLVLQLVLVGPDVPAYLGLVLVQNQLVFHVKETLLLL